MPHFGNRRMKASPQNDGHNIQPEGSRYYLHIPALQPPRADLHVEEDKVNTIGDVLFAALPNLVAVALTIKAYLGVIAGFLGGPQLSEFLRVGKQLLKAGEQESGYLSVVGLSPEGHALAIVHHADVGAVYLLRPHPFVSGEI